jgi:glutamate/tyrosine decarboxylase-like PLP-dependent enzyme
MQLMHQPDTGILSFRITPPGLPEEQLDALQEYIYRRIMAEGKRSISITRLNGRTVLRLVAISPAVTSEALMDTIAVVRSIARTYQKGATHEDSDY